MLNKNYNPSPHMKCYLIIALIALTGLAAKAQTRLRTDESVRSQLMNGTAPGLLFSKSVPTQKESAKGPVNMGSLGRQIRENAIPGMSYRMARPSAQSEMGPDVQAQRDTSRVMTGTAPKPVQKASFPATDIE